MKIGLLIHDNVWFCPYISLYIPIIEEVGAEYDIIYWNKEALNEKGIPYNYKFSNDNPNFMKLWGYLKYSRFIRKTIKKHSYDKLIIFGPQIGIFLYPFLKRRYFNKFIFDYRDLSIEGKFPKTFRKLLSISSLNVISSPGFKKCLPDGFDYLLSHNINRSLFNHFSGYQFKVTSGKRYVVLTIGALRDFESNKEVIDALGNDERFELRFVGRGPSEEDLKRYSIAKGFANVSFTGFYKKEDEYKYIEEADFLNIYYPRKISHDTALSNRFYNSLLFCKPMITTKDTIQGDYAEKYGVGIAIKNCSNLAENLISFTDGQGSIYMKGRNSVLASIKKDCETFDNMVKSFVKNRNL